MLGFILYWFAAGYNNKCLCVQVQRLIRGKHGCAVASLWLAPVYSSAMLLGTDIDVRFVVRCLLYKPCIPGLFCYPSIQFQVQDSSTRVETRDLRRFHGGWGDESDGCNGLTVKVRSVSKRSWVGVMVTTFPGDNIHWKFLDRNINKTFLEKEILSDKSHFRLKMHLTQWIHTLLK